MSEYLDVVVADGGVRGPEGPPGQDGEDGTSTWSGATPPTTDIGNVGDFYFNNTTNIFYGPKAASGTIWPVAIAMANQEQVESNTASLANLTSDLAAIDARVDANEGDIATINGNLDNVAGRVTTLEAGVILISPNGTHYRLTVSNAGVVGTTAV